MNGKRFEETLYAINQFGYSEQGINRIAFSEEEEKAKKYLITLFENEGLIVKTDAFGNIIARREGKDPTLPAVACGSHIDTVYNAGMYDGTIGVIAGLEVIRFLNEKEIITKHPIEVIVFASEESARFGVATIGSKVMTGLIEKKKLLSLKDKQGISIVEAMKKAGYSIDDLATAKRDRTELKAFYELHVEQGPILEKEQKMIGIVSGIAAPTRFQLKIIGESAHSGSTPMNLRKDAFSGASEIALTLEAIAHQEAKHGTVATVGNCVIKDGAMNVVPGEAEIIIDIRSISDESKNRVKEALIKRIKEIETERNLHIQVTKLCDEQPTSMDRQIIELVKCLSEEHGFSYMEMPSGAGHDAMNMAKIVPTGLIFVPSKNGISHTKDEYTSLEQIMIGVTLLKEVILRGAHVMNRAYCLEG